MLSRTSPWRAVVVVGTSAALVALLVGVRGEFPLSDDWSYAHTVQGLCRDGVIRFLPWTGASLLFQAAYGALSCMLFGFSFTILRASTIVLAAAGTAAFFVLLRRTGVALPIAAFATVLLGLDPLFVNLSFTFMTDVPFTVLCILAALLYAHGLDAGDRGSGRRLLIAAGIVCAAAVLVRQHGIFVAAAAGAAACLDSRLRVAARLGAAAAATAIPVTVFVVFHFWLFAIHGAPQGVANKLDEAGGAGFLGVANVAFRALQYLGLLLSPLALAVAPAVWAERRTTFLAALGTLGGLAVFLWLREGALMFDLPNVMFDFGLGALSLRDVLFLGRPAPVHLGAALSVPLTIVATLGAAVLVARWSGLRPSPARPVATFAMLAFVLLLAGSFVHTRFYFDRYLLPVLPFAIWTALGSGADVVPRAGAWGLAALLGWYAVAGTHDYMAWNRARHAALQVLEHRGIGPDEIDGGVEYNAWELAAKLGTWPSTAEAKVGQAADRKSWWWVVDDRFVVAFGELDGYRVLARFAYPRWLGPGTADVVLLEREGSAPSEPPGRRLEGSS